MTLEKQLEEQLSAVVGESLSAVTIIRPGDKLLLAFEQRLTYDQAQQVKDHVKEALGDDVPFLVYGSDIKGSVIRVES